MHGGVWGRGDAGGGGRGRGGAVRGRGAAAQLRRAGPGAAPRAAARRAATLHADRLPAQREAARRRHLGTSTHSYLLVSWECVKLMRQTEPSVAVLIGRVDESNLSVFTHEL